MNTEHKKASNRKYYWANREKILALKAAKRKDYRDHKSAVQFLQVLSHTKALAEVMRSM